MSSFDKEYIFWLTDAKYELGKTMVTTWYG